MKRAVSTPLANEQDMSNIRNRLLLLKNKQGGGIKQNKVTLTPITGVHSVKKENIAPLNYP